MGATTEYFNAPLCRCCGRRAQRKVGRLAWRCSTTGITWHYRITKEGLVPLSKHMAHLLDEERSYERSR